MKVIVINLGKINKLAAERGSGELIKAAARGDQAALDRFNELGRQILELSLTPEGRAAAGVTMRTFECPEPTLPPQAKR